MGVERTDYVIYGYKLSREQIEKHNIDWTEEKFEQYMNGVPGEKYRLVFDQMGGGKYMVFGKLVHESGKKENFTIVDPHDYVDVSLANKNVIELFIKLFSREVYNDLIPDYEPMLICFTHLY